jgi:hypothetical protein
MYSNKIIQALYLFANKWLSEKVWLLSKVLCFVVIELKIKLFHYLVNGKAKQEASNLDNNSKW